MAWIIASAPLWLIGVSCLYLGIIGPIEWQKTGDGAYLKGGLFFLVVAAFVLPIAAKVAS